MNISELTIPDPVFAQVKGGLSTSSVNPNSTIGERTGNTREKPHDRRGPAASVRRLSPYDNVPFWKHWAILLTSHLTLRRTFSIVSVHIEPLLTISFSL